MLRHALFVARMDLTHMLRQREALMWVFVMPLLFFYFIGTVIGGFGRPVAGKAHDPLALVAPADGGFLVDEIVRRLEQQDYQVIRVADAAAAARYTRQLTIPPPAAGTGNFTTSVLAGHAAELRFQRRGEGPDADFDTVRVARAVYPVVGDLAIMKLEGREPTAQAFAGLAAEPRPLTLHTSEAGHRRHVPQGFEQAVPGIMVMFTMLVLLTTGAVSLAVERDTGLLRRLASTPIPRAAVVLGKWVGRLALALVQIAYGVLLGWVLFGVQWGVALPMVCLVLLAWAAFNASFATVLGNVVRTPAQAAGVGVLVTMVLAALGGAWWPIEITPPFMQQLALFVPTGWTMDALHKLVSFRDPAVAALPHVLALAAGALVLGLLGVRTFRYQ